jgi:hypothetical protein
MRYRYLEIVTSVALSCAMALTGCEDESNEDNKCESAMQVLCDKACACSAPEEDCHYFSEGSSASTERKQCLEAEVFLNCGGSAGDPVDMDFDKCRAALKDASCGESDEGLAGLLLPEACAALLEYEW